MKKYRCFVVCAIGEVGSSTRQDADDLLDMVIRPALEIYDFEILRGDHRSEPNQIDIDVIKNVQESDLCIIDISNPNPNVYYELGRRDETGKDRILLKSRNSGDIPVDIATQRYIQYDLDSRHGVRDAVKQIRSFVDPMLERGFESNTAGSSLSDIAATLSRVERKVDRMIGNVGSQLLSSQVVSSEPEVLGGDPREVFTLAFRQRNLPLIERALDQLRLSVDKMKFLDYYVELASGCGSVKAGQILLDNAVEFIDSNAPYHKKIQYLGSVVGHLNRTDNELTYIKLVEGLCKNLWEMRSDAEPADIAQIFNQRNRLYHGIYTSTDNPEWLHKAISELEQAKEYVPEKSYVYFNLAVCYHSADDLVNARRNILHAIQLDGEEQDADHLEVACRILRELEDSEYPAMIERLKKISPIKAALLESK